MVFCVIVRTYQELNDDALLAVVQHCALHLSVHVCHVHDLSGAQLVSRHAPEARPDDLRLGALFHFPRRVQSHRIPVLGLNGSAPSIGLCMGRGGGGFGLLARFGRLDHARVKLAVVAPHGDPGAQDGSLGQPLARRRQYDGRCRRCRRRRPRGGGRRGTRGGRHPLAVGRSSSTRSRHGFDEEDGPARRGGLRQAQCPRRARRSMIMYAYIDVSERPGWTDRWMDG